MRKTVNTQCETLGNFNIQNIYRIIMFTLFRYKEQKFLYVKNVKFRIAVEVDFGDNEKAATFFSCNLMPYFMSFVSYYKTATG